MTGIRTTMAALASALTLVGAPAILTAGAAQAIPLIPASASQALPRVNDWGCVPSAEHPRPVILVHGTWSDAETTWSTLGPQLADEGYCVFAPDYGNDGNALDGNLLGLGGGANIDWSAAQLSAFVDRVLQETGARQVDMVGHSQGGLVARQYLRFHGGAVPEAPADNKVRNLVTLGATNHGSTFGDVVAISRALTRIGVPVQKILARTVGPSYAEQMVGSEFLDRLNAGGDTVPGVHYTVIASHSDRISTPPSNTFLTAGPGATVDNVWVQNGCKENTTSHEQLVSNPRSVYLVQSALDPAYAQTHEAPCAG
ncbi:esterase/lipase family protein [Tomitella gaofuii]|uniref:esterase/lipase family protein n=1 Tax=Tomitella gaofuii TaxID=2760083 RepID=UPI001F1C9CD2|nr:alpha/beta fold hydrolase [Tomitella gaofuii]